MSKVPTSVVGVDFGRYAIKSVLLSRRGNNRFVFSNYAVRPIDGPMSSPEEIAGQVKRVFKEMGGSAKACAVAISSEDAIIRIIDQPETPTELLREALRLNGMTLLNQDVKDFVLDCGAIKSSAPGNGAQESGGRVKYLVGGLPRTRVAQIEEGFQQVQKNLIDAMQLAPICGFNAFEFAHEEIFNTEAFMLVDIGHSASTVTVGVKRELILVRAIDFGGEALFDTLVSHCGGTREEAIAGLERGDNEMTIEAARLALTALTREISSSIGFFEGRREENIVRIFVSGGPARSKMLLQILTEELHMPCESWDPFRTCEVTLSANRKQTLADDFVNLNVACGAAAEMLKGDQ
jgi:type IV pilus assembly protein PilM